MITNDIIFYVGISIVLLAFIALIYLQIKSNGEHAGNVTVAETALRNATIDLDQKRRNLFQSITETFGQERANQINNGEIYVGMSSFLVIIAKGYAEDIKESFYKDIRTEKWYYDGYVNRLGNTNYNFEITLENEEVVGWKNLK